MEYLIYLACPLGMGLMMWMMMRGSQGQAVDSPPAPAPGASLQPLNTVESNHRETPASVPMRTSAAPSEAGHRGWRSALCFDWKVLAGLAAVGVGVWVVAPGWVGAALPLLLLAACPLSMLLMMRGRQGAQCAPQAAPPPPPALTRDEQVAELKAQLATVQAQQEALAQQIAALEAPSAPVLPEPAAEPSHEPVPSRL